MRTVIWLGAAIGAAALLGSGPLNDDRERSALTRSTTTAEVQLIASLRELARVDEDEERPVRRVAAATPPLDAAPPPPGPIVTAARAESSGDDAEILFVTAEALNLRAGPSSGSEVRARLLQGQKVQVAGNQGGWLEVTTPDGLSGWAYSQYLSQAEQ